MIVFVRQERTTQDSNNSFSQVKDKLVEQDDILMSNVIKATENLKRATQHISDVFNETAPSSGTGNGSDIRVSLVGNTCGVLYQAINQTFHAMGEKACRIEKYAGILVFA